MSDLSIDRNGALNRAAVDRIEASVLPNLDRHHLRLLAHCLASFHAMQPANNLEALPNASARRAWCLSQPLIAEDPAFLELMMDQLEIAAVQLEEMASARGITVMALSLDDLIATAEARCKV